MLDFLLKYLIAIVPTAYGIETVCLRQKNVFCSLPVATVLTVYGIETD